MRILLLLLTLFYATCANAQEKVVSKKAEELLNEAATLYHQQRYVSSLRLSKEAFSISLINNDEYHLALSYNLIGAVYNEFAQSDRALSFYAKGLAYANNVDNDTLRLWLNSNIGNVYFTNDIDVEKAILYYSKSLKLAEKIQDSSQIAFIRLNIANAYAGSNKIEEGITFIVPIDEYIQRKGNTESKIAYYNYLAKFQSIKNRNLEAEANFLKAISLAKEFNFNIELHDAYQSLAEHYKALKDFSRSQKYQKLADTLKVNLKATDKLDKIEELATQIELDEYKFQFERIELKNEVQNQKIRESRIYIIAVCVIISILFILLYTLYRNNKTRKKNNIALQIANKELMKAKNIAEENSILKSKFISTVSHELRTPLYGVIGLTNIILEENKNLVNEENLDSLRFSAQYLLALVNDLLEINKAEEKKIILNKSPFNLREEVEIINNSLEFMADGNGNDLLIRIDENVPKTLVGDKLRLSQILINLISNALKFTSDGVVTIEAKLVTKDEIRCEIEFKVSDTGVGIKEEDQEKIFEKFVQIERKQLDYQGTGLGLPIVKKLVELFGGNISVQSAEERGTTFYFTIAFDYVNLVPKVNNTSINNELMQKELRFLIVEDNKINQLVTRKIIERKKYTCAIVDGGFDALEVLKTNAFDIILMDINMPQIDGYETSKRIRELGIKTPIIALTAFEAVEVQANAADFGITGVISKPFNTDILFEMVEKLLLLNQEEV